ncbi:MAG: hypothetical protein BWY78_00864 [Alphaproteobacteria bacterium ADurb.Bin438]|nr:MAG: hypothetical protein BWY78_00864 [Alphaproteobacteria bacterium ADurb.Bin438]
MSNPSELAYAIGIKKRLGLRFAFAQILNTIGIIIATVPVELKKPPIIDVTSIMAMKTLFSLVPENLKI